MEVQNNNNVELGLHHGGLNQSWALERMDIATSISLDKSHAMISFGDVYQLTATLYPSYSNSSITWSTDNPNVATVNQSGLVTMQSVGTATITARVNNNVCATCFVSSLQHPLVDDHIKIYSGSLVYNCNGTLSQNSERNASQDFRVTYYPLTGYYRIYSPSLQSYVGLDWRIENAPNNKYYFIQASAGKYLSISSNNTVEISETPYAWSVGPCYIEGITRNEWGIALNEDDDLFVAGDYWDYAMVEEPILIAYDPEYYEEIQLAIDAWNDLGTGVVLGFATDETANGTFVFMDSDTLGNAYENIYGMYQGYYSTTLGRSTSFSILIFVDNIQEKTPYDENLLIYTMIHELGHALGIGHDSNGRSIYNAYSVMNYDDYDDHRIMFPTRVDKERIIERWQNP